MELIKNFQMQFESYLKAHQLTRQPLNLYEPADYILSLGGKRLRPVFTLLGCDLYGEISEFAMNAAMAVEVFHNFTLLHDDIMDKAEVRRGKPTVHIKYNTNTAILTGDVMMIQAYQYLLNYQDPNLFKQLMHVFNKMAFEVCEGQQMDMDFENREDVSINEYLEMITLKTSVLIAASVQMGAIIGGADAVNQKHIYEFAKNFGIAFQLQDDILDTFGESANVGKRIGGDILQNKKTYLYLKTKELADQNQHKTLLKYFHDVDLVMDEQKKIDEVTQIFKDVNVVEYTRQLIEAYRDLSISHLRACDIASDKKERLSDFINDMIFRAH
ncbi:MAG: polyprenyl synthetase family protein [Saprospiraceae bacterium]|nr:polyprenyl synthetase family protein [Saprospiraceae bacterium]